MKLEQQVSSLKLSKKLKKLGVKQDSLWYWIKIADEWQVQQFSFGEKYHKEVAKRDDLISAFTVAELGEMLPSYCEVTFRNKDVDRKQLRWNCDNKFNEEEAKTEADARAKMLCYLLENDLIKL